MLGYMSAEQARGEGFTHHGRYYGIPIWIGDPDDTCMVAAKWAPMELAMLAAMRIEGALHALRGTEPSFALWVGAEIG